MAVENKATYREAVYKARIIHKDPLASLPPKVKTANIQRQSPLPLK